MIIKKRDRASFWGGVIALLLFSCTSVNDFFDFTEPVVEKVNPAAESWNIKTNQQFTLTFSKEIDVSSAKGAIFLKQNGESVICDLKWESDMVVTIVPKYPFEKDKEITLVCTTELKDEQGNSLHREFKGRYFTGGKEGQLTVSLKEGSVEYLSPTNRRPTFLFIFSEPLAEETVWGEVITFSPQFPCLYKVSSNLLSCLPLQDLQIESWYTATIKSSLTGLFGGKLPEDTLYSWYLGVPEVGPHIVGMSSVDRVSLPLSLRYFTNGERTLRTATHLIFDFSEEMDSETTRGALKIIPAPPGVANWLTPTRLEYRLSEPLLYGKRYQLSFSREARNCKQRQLASAWEISLYAENTLDAPLSILKVSNVGVGEITSSEISYFLAPVSRKLLFQVVFDPKEDHPVTLLTLLEYTTFRQISGPVVPHSAELIDVRYNPLSHVASLTVTNVYPDSYYELSFTGGNSGVSDEVGNVLDKEYRYLLQTE